jgi:potassium-transporting ATPase KdpC subunit
MHDTQTVIADHTVAVPAGTVEHSLWSTSIRFTLITTLLLGIAYPLIVTGIASVLFPHQAAGSLIEQNGQVIGSQLLAQGFASDKYFHPRPSAAGNGYDATSSGGSNLAQSNAKLVQRVQGDIDKLAKENPNAPVPIDLVTTSGSGLDPDITPEAAYFQAPRIAHTRGLTEPQVRQLIAQHVASRRFGILGEARVNVLELNLDLDKLSR